MGYTTEFKGELRFVHAVTVEQLAALNEMFCENCREHPEWNAPKQGYVDLMLTKDLGGIEWDDGTEKADDLTGIVNVVIKHMRSRWPDFALTGTLMAQGEEIEDRWALTIGDDGLAHKQKLAPTGKVIRCPHCREKFMLEGADQQ